MGSLIFRRSSCWDPLRFYQRLENFAFNFNNFTDIVNYRDIRVRGFRNVVVFKKFNFSLIVFPFSFFFFFEKYLRNWNNV